MTLLLVVEDDRQVSGPVVRYLKRNGFDAELSETVASARQFLQRRQPAAIVLDRLLPDGNGLDLLAQLRRVDAHFPVIVVSALGTIDDQIQGFQTGATDYISKPIYLPLLIERIRASLRTHSAHNPPLVLDVERKLVSNGVTTVKLAQTELTLLVALAKTKSRVSRNQLLHLWPANNTPRARTIDYYIFRLRRKLAAIHRSQCIATERGGYSLKAFIQFDTIGQG